MILIIAKYIWQRMPVCPSFRLVRLFYFLSYSLSPVHQLEMDQLAIIGSISATDGPRYSKIIATASIGDAA